MVHHRSSVGDHNPFVNYYVNQARGDEQRGGALPYFAGVKFQRGSGIGSFFGNLFGKIKNALPYFFKTAAKHAFQTGSDVANDLLE